MSWLRRSGCVSFLFQVLLLAGCKVCAQENAAAAGETSTLHVSSQLVLVDVAVEGRKSGKPVVGLSPADFAVQEDGELQTVTSLSQDTLPLSLTLLLDLTDTVHPVLLHLAAGADALLHHLRPQDEVAVMTFSSGARRVQGFTRDRMTAREALDDASATYDRAEPTFVFEDLWQASTQSARTHLPDARRVQVWLTDGSANDQDMQRGLAQHAPAILHSEAQATAALEASGAVVATLLERTPEAAAHDSGRFGDIERFARLTGGPVVWATAADTENRLSSLLDGLRLRYTLGYRPRQARPDGTLCRLHVELSPAFFAGHPEFKQRDLAVRSRESYVRAAPAR